MAQTRRSASECVCVCVCSQAKSAVHSKCSPFNFTSWAFWLLFHGRKPLRLILNQVLIQDLRSSGDQAAAAGLGDSTG